MTLTKFEIGKEFQTPPVVAEYMKSLIPEGVVSVLEPTPGEGNILNLLGEYQVTALTAPANFFALDPRRFDCVVMNPPFSTKYAFGVPDHVEASGLRLGYHI